MFIRPTILTFIALFTYEEINLIVLIIGISLYFVSEKKE